MAIEDLWYKNAIIYCLSVEKYPGCTISRSRLLA
jgi:hypothetical protein